MSKKICKSSEAEELAHFVISEFMVHPKAEQLIKNENNEAMAFISAMIRNNYYSNTSRYHKIYRQSRRVFNDRYIPDEAEELYDIELDYTIEMIEGILEEMELDRGDMWYRASLFRMWIETNNVSEIHRRTDIPRQSIANAIRECVDYIRNILQERGQL